MKISTILINEGIKKEFNRLDLCVNYITIDNIINSKEDYYLYGKMHEKRIQSFNTQKRIISFKKLIKIFKEKNENLFPPIGLYKNGTIKDGAHRLSCAIYFKNKDIK